jgi:hypothetical protein
MHLGVQKSPRKKRRRRIKLWNSRFKNRKINEILSQRNKMNPPMDGLSFSNSSILFVLPPSFHDIQQV